MAEIITHDAVDDGFHEIQLSGKQLVFLFMATTAVSVMIFLCGVLVGRDVRGERAAQTVGRRLDHAGSGPRPRPRRCRAEAAGRRPAGAGRRAADTAGGRRADVRKRLEGVSSAAGGR